MFKKCFDRFKNKSKNSLRRIDKNTMLKIIRNLKNKCMNILKEKKRSRNISNLQTKFK